MPPVSLLHPRKRSKPFSQSAHPLAAPSLLFAKRPQLLATLRTIGEMDKSPQPRRPKIQRYHSSVFHTTMQAQQSGHVWTLTVCSPPRTWFLFQRRHIFFRRVERTRKRAFVYLRRERDKHKHPIETKLEWCMTDRYKYSVQTTARDGSESMAVYLARA